MPVPSFLSSIADKAQAAVNNSPLASHLPHPRPTSPGHEQPTANQAAAQGSHPFGGGAFGAIQHQLRSLGQQYTSATPVQKIITTEKGVAIDFDSIARDSKTQSKELYTWGQNESDDLKDVTDRLAYLNFVQGSLASSLAVKLDSARASLKQLRDAETAITPRRNIRSGLALQIGRIEHDQQKGNEKRLEELREQLRRAEAEDADQEKQIEILKRKAVRESEQQKWDAIREYGEKLVLLAQAATPIIGALPTIPPSKEQPYLGGQTTAAARASLQRALDNYKTGHINLPNPAGASDLSRSDTRSFGESHASELSSMVSSETHLSIQPGIPLTPPSAQTSLPAHPPSQAQGPPSSYKPPEGPPPNRATTQSPPMNPATLNNAPAPIPTPASPKNSATSVSPAPATVPDPANPSVKIPAVTPTVAETGVPVSAGDKGPGPASGSLHDIKAAAPTAGPKSAGLPGRDTTSPGSGFGQLPAAGATGTAPAKYESAEDEKKRLQREERERILAQSNAPPPAAPAPTATTSGPTATPAFESAEEEKKRLEREERERLLREGSSGGAAGGNEPKKDDEELPPYQDM